MIAGAVKNVLMGVSVGGVFYNTTDPFSIQGALFQGGLFIMLGKSKAARIVSLIGTCHELTCLQAQCRAPRVSCKIV
jgi:hypothetical protein